MSFNHYYQSELSALRQMGKRFAERNPALAPFLGQSGKDPDVERLLEGFAFLTGRLRQKLDDELPELTHSLMHLLWPNYMRPLPAFSMLQFDPVKRAGPAVRVARDTPVESVPVQGINCQFRTTSEVEVLPLQLSQLDYSVKGDGALLSLKLSMVCDGNLKDLALRRLRLHLAGERYISQMLYLGLLRHLDGIELVLLDKQGTPLPWHKGPTASTLRLAAEQVQPTGFEDNQALIPYPLNTFSGYRYLQEYFAFEDKFLFVDINGLECLGAAGEDVLQQAAGLELRCHIRKAGIQRIRPSSDNVRLYCTPVVNLFNHDATPIRLDGRQDHYLLRPAEYASHQCGVYSVERVTGWKPGGMGYEDYVPFESFEHDHSFDVTEPKPHYSVRQSPSIQGDGLETYLSFGTRSSERHETLSIELMCTNQNLPSQLGIGDICRLSEDTPDYLSFRNISTVTPSYAPPLDSDFLWKLISNMSLNYLSLANVEALKVILETYDLPRYYDQHAARVGQRRLEGLKKISHSHVDRLHHGLPVRGIRTELLIDGDNFLGEGDLFLFASVLDQFFALYASLNSFHELQVSTTQGERYQWTPRMGQQPLL
ncbi:type VI secretion system baseplate subunit TssF [Halopseudomonas phragmitis]|uniref:Type VI secretion protein n=1 Tax=Halopseudomonas phragmitis TaxID=1931241 RepID=A0A1V0B631_9GAMM|nr:type VI secretion system baseplate subunit TssF [Halopseudomonas phragmitis]AQZ95377.1 type VI secretion protein [Halopseudomonas phragmitis]